MVTLVADAGLLQRFGDVIVVGIVLALTAYGAHFGLFLAVIAGMHALVSVVVALAFAEPLAGVLKMLEVPDAYTFPAAFAALLIGVAFAIRLAVGGFVPADVVRFTPGIDKLVGGLMGTLAGVVVAGTVLIAGSIMPLPPMLRLDGSKLTFDVGTRMLRTFVRCVEPGDDVRMLLEQGEQPQVSGKQPVGAGPSCSEVFADANGNDDFDDGESYLDADRNGSFTLQLPYADSNGNGKRDVGLLERYQLASWRAAKVFYAPTIDSAPTVAVPAEVSDGDVVYQIVAIDLDPKDTFTYGMRIEPQQAAAGTQKRSTQETDEDESGLLAVDRTTGEIKMANAELFVARRPKQLKIVVTVTDRHGLTSEKAVTVTRLAAKSDSARPASDKP
jgi:hypothetical protein